MTPFKKFLDILSVELNNIPQGKVIMDGAVFRARFLELLGTGKAMAEADLQAEVVEEMRRLARISQSAAQDVKEGVSALRKHDKQEGKKQQVPMNKPPVQPLASMGTNQAKPPPAKPSKEECEGKAKILADKLVEELLKQGLDACDRQSAWKQAYDEVLPYLLRGENVDVKDFIAELS